MTNLGRCGGSDSRFYSRLMIRGWNVQRTFKRESRKLEPRIGHRLGVLPADLIAVLLLGVALTITRTALATNDHQRNALAVLNGEPVNTDAFREYVDQARWEGYSIQTEAEALRLLRALLRERLVDQQVRRLQAKDARLSREDAERQLLLRFGRPDVALEESELDALVLRHLATRAKPVSETDRDSFRSSVAAQRQAEQRRFILDAALDRQQVEIDQTLLRSQLQPGDQAQIPPFPPTSGVGTK